MGEGKTKWVAMVALTILLAGCGSQYERGNHQEPLVIDGSENADIQIIGKVLWIMKRP